MKYLLPVVMILVAVVVVGCGYTPPYDQDWITPVEFKIGNYAPGKEADGFIKLFNGDEKTTRTDRWEVITEPDETKVPMHLKAPLKSGIEDIKVASDNPADNLVIEWYESDDRLVGISGFAPDQSRIITLVYDVYKEYRVFVRLPDHPKEGFIHAPPEITEWVLIGDGSPVVLEPKETLEVPIILLVPDGAEVPDEPWEFWVVVAEANPGMVSTEMAQRWMINGDYR